MKKAHFSSAKIIAPKWNKQLKKGSGKPQAGVRETKINTTRVNSDKIYKAHEKIYLKACANRDLHDVTKRRIGDIKIINNLKI